MKRVDPSIIRKLSLVGRGSLAKVYKLESEDFGIVAGKYIEIFDPSVQERVTKEVEIIKRIRHPNIIQLNGISETDEFFIILMKYAENGDLFNYIEKIRNNKTEFD